MACGIHHIFHLPLYFHFSKAFVSRFEWLMVSVTYQIFHFIFILVRRSCQEYKDSGSVSDGEYLIDPDGPDKNEAPVRVYCDITETGLAGK